MEFTEIDRARSEQIEELLIAWHRWQDSYRPAMGFPRCDPSLRDCEIPATGQTAAEKAEVADAKIWKRNSEAVEACVDALPKWEHRAALQTVLHNKRVGVSVFSNPRLSAEDSHRFYQEAKELLYPRFVTRGLIKIEVDA